MNSAVEIRTVAYEEIDAFAKVIRDSFRDVAEEFGLTRENCPTHTSFLEADRLRKEYENGYHMFGAYAGGTPVGYVGVKEIGDGAWELDHLAVLPAYRHHGVGRRLIDRCVSEVRQYDAVMMKIGIIEENTRLKDWYISYGFCHSGVARFPHLPFTVGFLALEIQ